MKSILSFVFLLTTLPIISQDLKTEFEKSGGKRTVTYEEGIKYWKNLSSKVPEIQMQVVGNTDSGEPLHAVIYNQNKVFDISSIRNSGKGIILINNAIHAGEPDGVDASMMLIRNFSQNPSLYPYLQDVTIVIIPFYNIGGVLNRSSSSRANQNGPEEYGFRGNARLYDLNRDFMKMDTKNARSFGALFQQLDPDVFVDTHVTNGSNHQHVLTLISTQHNKLGGKLGSYLEDTFEPQIFELLKEKGRAPVEYVNVHGHSPNEGWSQFWDAARYSSGYASLFQTLGFISESHMWKPYDERVQNTYDFLEVMVKLTAENKSLIKEKKRLDRLFFKDADSLPILWKNDKDKFRMVNLLGYETSMKQNDFTGNPILYYDLEKPIEKMVPFYNVYAVVEKAKVPEHYLIPQAWYEVIERLKINGVEMNKLKNDTTISVQAYEIDSYETAKMAYEGHYIHYNTRVKAEKLNLKFRKGDYLVPTNQSAIKYIVESLEPSAQDSFFNWNYFDTILQQKEYFSDYVFAAKADSILKSLPAKVQQEFYDLKDSDSTFAKSNNKQLNFVYERSSHYEQSYLRYPVYKIVHE